MLKLKKLTCLLCAVLLACGPLSVSAASEPYTDYVIYETPASDFPCTSIVTMMRSVGIRTSDNKILQALHYGNGTDEGKTEGKLNQNGTIYWAKKGWGYTQILDYYYSNYKGTNNWMNTSPGPIKFFEVT